MAGAHTKNHDYHLVDPSPWPFVASVSAFVMAVGAVMTMKAMTMAGLKLGPYLLGAGFLGVHLPADRLPAGLKGARPAPALSVLQPGIAKRSQCPFAHGTNHVCRAGAVVHQPYGFSRSCVG